MSGINDGHKKPMTQKLIGEQLKAMAWEISTQYLGTTILMVVVLFIPTWAYALWLV